MPSPTLSSLLQPIRPFLDDPAVEEIIVNRPNEVWTYKAGRFVRHDVEMDDDDVMDLGIVAGAQRRQDVGRDSPLLATDLGGLGRLQVVLHPCVADGRSALAIRRGNTFSPTLDDLATSGLFKSTRRRRAGPSDADAGLLQLYRDEDWEAFFPAAVLAKKTIIACGETASGKTTFAKALINSIPLDERLITIEDTPEWTDLPQPNQVNMLYDKDAVQGEDPTARDLVAAALRMRIGRLLVQELRDGQAAFAFLRALGSGHPGGITTVHAPNPEEAFTAIALQLKETPAGAAMTQEDIMLLLRGNVHVIVHTARSEAGFKITEVWCGLADEGDR